MDDFVLSLQVIVIEPSKESWHRVQDAMTHHGGHEYDMDILNKVFGKSTLVIPHRRYDLLTGEFQHKSNKHEAYLGSPSEIWNAKKTYWLRLSLCTSLTGRCRSLGRRYPTSR
jgi:hypothetical protein